MMAPCLGCSFVISPGWLLVVASDLVRLPLFVGDSLAPLPQPPVVPEHPARLVVGIGCVLPPRFQYSFRGEVLYDLMMNEYPKWIKLAKQQNILS